MGVRFTPETLRFLRGLAKNNDRAWFEERRAIYERSIKAPLLAVIEEINGGLQGFAPEHVRAPHKVAMRIFRDTRFSPDKRPYKSHLAAWWARQGLEKASGAGFYLHLDPAGSFVAAGLYAPERDALLAVRRHLADKHQEFRALLQPLLKSGKNAPAMQPIEPAALTRNPKGFAPEHPASDLLRARHWGVTSPLEPEAFISPELPGIVLRQFRRALPVLEFLNEPLLAARSVRPRPIA